MKKIIAIFTLTLLVFSMASCRRGAGNVGDDVSDMASDVVSDVGDMKDKITENVTDRTTEKETERETEMESESESSVDSAIDSGTQAGSDGTQSSAPDGTGADTTDMTTGAESETSPEGGTGMRSFFNWR